MKKVLFYINFFVILTQSLSLVAEVELVNYRFNAINDVAYQYTGGMPTGTYHRYCKNIYSQNGEDGILEQLLKELRISTGTFFEFGASDGIYSSNTYNLMQNYGFSGAALEIDKAAYERCVANYKNFPQVKVLHGAVLYNDKYNDLDAWLTKAGVPYDLDILSIDVDGDDYYIWENMKKFSPKIVIFETNSYRDPIYEEKPGKKSTDYNIDPLAQWMPSRVAVGCSFMSAVKLGLEKGYIPVAYTGNITFVRKDLVHLLKEFPCVVSENPYDYVPLYTHLVLWKNQWMSNSGLILNTAIRDYYLNYGKRHIDVGYLLKQMNVYR